MSVSVRRHIILAVLGLVFTFQPNIGCLAQEPENPPLEDEVAPLPSSEVPAIFDAPPAKFEEPGQEKVLDNQLPAQDQEQVIDGEDLRPGQEETFNQQLPGYDSEAARLLDNTLPAPVETQSTQSGTFMPNANMTRREAKMQRKAEKNKPVDLPELSRDAFRISAGRKSDTYKESDVIIAADSLITVVRDNKSKLPQIISEVISDSTTLTEAVTPRQQRQLERMQRRADSMYFRHSPLFRDTLKLGNLTTISLVVPGFGQLYNGDYWKIPVLYATVGASLYFGIQQNKQYRTYRNEYDYLTSRSDFSDNRSLIDPVQTKMIQHNTWSQLLFGTAIASYIYFLGDAIVNYPGNSYLNNIQKATLLSTICPGAGQFYNGSYWKAPLVLGGFATFAYVIDWNNRGYQRYKRAVELATDNDQDTNSPEGLANMSVDQMKSYKRLYRRNRDLSIILTAAFYLLNVMDAHVDAYMKDFDTNDDLTWQLMPTMDSINTMKYGQTHTVGLGLSLTF